MSINNIDHLAHVPETKTSPADLPSLTAAGAACFAEAVQAAAAHRPLQRQVSASPRGYRDASDHAVDELVAAGLLESAGNTRRGDKCYCLTASGRVRGGLPPSTERRLADLPLTIPTPCPTLTALRREADLSLALVRAGGALEAAEQDLAAYVPREVLEARVARQRAEVARLTAEHSAAKARLARVIPIVTQADPRPPRPPVRVRILHTIKSDWFPGLPGPRLVVDPGVYIAESNPLGALSIRTPGGLLGIKPGEFERIEDSDDDDTRAGR